MKKTHKNKYFKIKFLLLFFLISGVFLLGGIFISKKAEAGSVSTWVDCQVLSNCGGGGGSSPPPPPPTCNYTYSSWTQCLPYGCPGCPGRQTRTESYSPEGCVGGDRYPTAQDCSYGNYSPYSIYITSGSYWNPIYSGESTNISTYATNLSCAVSGGSLGTIAWYSTGSSYFDSGVLTENTPFALSCSGSGGSVSATTMTNVKPIIPVNINEFGANPLSVLSGSSVTFYWSVSGATDCEIVNEGKANYLNQLISDCETNWEECDYSAIDQASQDYESQRMFVPGGISSYTLGPLTASTAFTLYCGNYDRGEANQSILITVRPKIKPKLTIKPSEAIWDIPEGWSCTLKRGTEIIRTGLSGTGNYIEENLPVGVTFTLECEGPDGTASSSGESIRPATKSNCAPLQSGNTTGDLYTNRITTWTLENTDGIPSNVEWNGADILQTFTELPILNKIYTTVGFKGINAIATITRPDETTFTSQCHATTTIKIDPRSSQEI